MLLQVFTRDDETGLLDDEFRDGDVLQTFPDSFEGSLGSQDKKSYLVIKIPDPPNIAKFEDGFVRPEYAPGPTPESPNVIRKKRIYSLPWRNSFNASEIAIIEDAASILPDGPLSSGGSVALGVVSGKFTVQDFVRK